MSVFRRLLLGLLVPITMNAGAINLGVVSFDAVQPGLNVFNIANYTGDPALGGFALPPDFPVYTNVTLLASSLTVYQGNASQVIFLGDIPAGTFTSAALEFPDTAQISSTIFTATLSGVLLTHSDNSVHLVAPDISIVLLPSSGQNLSGGDLAVIEATQVPEPGSGASGFGGLLLLGLVLKVRRTICTVLPVASCSDVFLRPH